MLSKFLDNLLAVETAFQTIQPKGCYWEIPMDQNSEQLDKLSIEQVHLLHRAVLQDIQDLHSRWSELSSLADPQYDDEILKIFARLDQLELECLPHIEKRLNRKQRPAERAA